MHLARLLSIQMTAVGIGSGVQQAAEMVIVLSQQCFIQLHLQHTCVALDVLEYDVASDIRDFESVYTFTKIENLIAL